MLLLVNLHLLHLTRSLSLLSVTLQRPMCDAECCYSLISSSVAGLTGTVSG